jgi:CDP-paratose 2-epimerase
MTADSARGGWPASVLVTGGAGFIGCNVVRHLNALGVTVTALDNFSRANSNWNAEQLRRDLGDDLHLVNADIRDASAVAAAAAGADAIVHLAGQTAVTRSIEDPHGDFLDNCVGTFNVLEAARTCGRDPIVIFASTNKVYGALDDLAIVEESDHYRFEALPDGVDEQRPIDPTSPYACSKSAAESYVVDYARTYGLRTVTFRQSCVYGEHQWGIEDQGWLAWFLIASKTARPITIFGNGKQVRDLLHVDDLFAAFTAAVARIDRTAGQVYNVGGGTSNSVSIWWQLAPLLEDALGRHLPEPTFAPPRLGDQRIFIADTRKAREHLGWTPTITIEDGIRRLVDWVDTVAVPGAS